MLEESAGALQEAEEREGAETRVQLMESQCKELESLADQVEKQAVTETEPEPLIELEEEKEYKKDNVVSLALALKETIPAEFKERAQDWKDWVVLSDIMLIKYISYYSCVCRANKKLCLGYK